MGILDDGVSDEKAIRGLFLHGTQLSNAKIDQCKSNDGNDIAPEEPSSPAISKRQRKRDKKNLLSAEQCSVEAEHGKAAKVALNSRYQ